MLAGAGDGFSAGADLADLQGTTDDTAMDDAIQGVASSIRDCAAPVIAAVEGPCIGGALEVALASDAIVAAEARTSRSRRRDSACSMIRARWRACGTA